MSYWFCDWIRRLEYAELKMNQYRDKLWLSLISYPDSEVKESLREFVNYTTSRKNRIILFLVKLELPSPILHNALNPARK